MEKIDFCFLILHYRDAVMTEQAVSSILSLNDLKSYAIIIVDNASPDQSGLLLKELYKDVANIHLIEAGRNGGFSRGNNLGYQFIKKNFAPEFLICVNNDVLFTQKDFLGKLKQLYARQPFYICGPDIYIPWRDFHSNPLSSNVKQYTLYDVEREREQIEKSITACKRPFSLKIFKLYFFQKARKYVLMQKIYRIVRSIQNHKTYMSMQENVILSGACLVFDRRFIDENSRLFTPETFLYREEQILAMRCRVNHWNTVYAPELAVSHIHEGNSNLGDLSYREFCRYLVKKAGYQRQALSVLGEYIREGKSGYDC